MKNNLIVKPIHVAKFIPPAYAGVESHVDTLLRALSPDVNGTLVAGESHLRSLESNSKLPYRTLIAKSFGRIDSVTISPSVVKHVRDDIRSGYSNLLHIHAPNPWGDFAALLSPSSIPVVMSWHSDIIRQKILMIPYSVIQKRVIDRVDRIVTCTPKHYESSKQLQQLNIKDKIRFIPYGINFEHLNKENASNVCIEKISNFINDRPFLLSVGRHVYYKGYEYLLKAISKIKTDTVLVMVGSGLLSNDLKVIAKELEIEHRVLFLGEVNNEFLVSLLHKCDLFCLPSIEQSEAFGIASAEAMACCKAVIVCDLNNGVNYLNIPEKTGLTVKPKDVNSLANAIDTLMLDDTLRSEMGKFACNWVRKEFSIEEMKDKTIALYRELI